MIYFSFFSRISMIFTRYLHSSYRCISFTRYTDDIFQVISNLHVQISKFGGNLIRLMKKLQKTFFKIMSLELSELTFSNSALSCKLHIKLKPFSLAIYFKQIMQIKLHRIIKPQNRFTFVENSQFQLPLSLLVKTWDLLKILE